MGVPEASAAAKAKGSVSSTTIATTAPLSVASTTTTAPAKQAKTTKSAPTTTSTTAATRTPVTTTSTTSTTSTTEAAAKKAKAAEAPVAPTSTTTRPTSASTTTSTVTNPTSTTTDPTSTTTSTTGPGSTTTTAPGGSGGKSPKTQASVRVPNQCGRSPMGPITNGQTITTTGTVTLTTPIILDNCTDVTFNGGTFNDPNTSPGKAYGGGVGNGRPAFTIVSGSNIVLENLKISGVNSGGEYRSDLAFNSGIWTDGTNGLTVANVKVAHVFGDCLTLAPLRSDKGSSGIISPVRNLTVNDFRANACGRQGIALSSVNGAALTNVTIGATAFDAFDAEADQPGKEGAMNVTVDQCSFSGLIAIKAGGGFTGPITFSNCTMSGTTSGSVLSVYNSSGRPDAGPISFVNDALRCGASAYVSCFQLDGATNTNVQNSTVTIGYHQDLVHEAAYSLSGNSHITFADDVVKGFGKLGHAWAGSAAVVTGGTWTAQNCHAPVVCPGH
jgi:hypothetical protein